MPGALTAGLMVEQKFLLTKEKLHSKLSCAGKVAQW